MMMMMMMISVLYSVRRPVTALKPEELLELLENQSKY
jgi:hypothetical protein